MPTPIETIAETVQKGLAIWEAWGVFVDQANAWVAGTADGGPNNDGMYPLTNRSGATQLLPCPARLAAKIEASALGVAPFDRIVEIAPVNADIGPFLALYVGAPGAVTLRTTAGIDVTYTDCFAGQIIEAPFAQVRTTTTAGSLIALGRALAPVLGVPQSVAPIAPADVNLPEGGAVSVFVGGGGDVALMAYDGSTATFRNCPASLKLPIRTLQVRAATTATNLIGGFS